MKILAFLFLSALAFGQLPPTPNLGLTNPAPHAQYAADWYANFAKIDAVFPSSTCGGDGIGALTYNAGTKKFGCKLSSLVDDGNGNISTNLPALQFNFGGSTVQFSTGSTLLEFVGANYDVVFDGSTGIIGVNNGSLVLGASTKATFSPTIFSSLSICNSAAEGTIKSVTDSTTATWGAVIGGSSTNHVLAYCDGTNWTVMGK